MNGTCKYWWISKHWTPLSRILFPICTDFVPDLWAPDWHSFSLQHWLGRSLWFFLLSAWSELQRLRQCAMLKSAQAWLENFLRSLLVCVKPVSSLPQGLPPWPSFLAHLLQYFLPQQQKGGQKAQGVKNWGYSGEDSPACRWFFIEADFKGEIVTAYTPPYS